MSGITEMKDGLITFKVVIIASLLFAAVGCTPSVRPKDLPPDHMEKPMTICEIRAKRDALLNKIVTTNGNLVSDGRTYTYFEDPACGIHRNTLQASSFTKIQGDEAVKKFIDARNMKCSTSPSAYCFGDLNVSFSGRIYEDDEGMLAVELLHIYEWHSVVR